MLRTPPQLTYHCFGRMLAVRKGFTLIELLIVVAVISILAALLVPVIKGGMTAAQSAKCVSNLKAIGGGLAAYISDHNGDFPPCASLPNTIYRKKTFWFDALNPYMGYPTAGADRAENFPAPETVGSEFPFSWQLCPVKKSIPLQRQSVGYGWNISNFGLDATAGAASGYESRLSQVSQPSKTIIIGDSKDADVKPDDTFENRYIYDYDKEKKVPYPVRHSSGGNYLFVDGHVDWISAKNMSSVEVRNLFKRNK